MKNKKMNMIFKKEPFEHFIIKNFYSEEELDGIWQELNFFINTQQFTNEQAALGSAFKADDEEKAFLTKRSGLFLHNFYTDFRKNSLIYKNFKKLYNPETMNEMSSFSILGKYLKHTNQDSVLISFYEDEDYYKPHHDSAILTAIVHLWPDNNKTFEGGELVFPDYNYSIESDYNQCIVFPSCLEHEVPMVKKTNTSKHKFNRIAIAMFITTTINK